MPRPGRCINCGCVKKLDEHGRCGLCGASKSASDSGISYGKRQAILYDPENVKLPEREGNPLDPERRGRFNEPGKCRWCGKPLPEGRAHARLYCDWHCGTAAAREQKRTWREKMAARTEIPAPEGAGEIWTAREMY